MKAATKNKKNKLSFTKAIIVAHEASSGPEHDLRDYLLDNSIPSLLCINHPLLYLEDMGKKRSYYELYQNGKLIKSGRAYHWVLPEYLLYIKDIFYTFYWIIRFNFRSEIFFGVNNLNAFTGILLKYLGYTKITVYYVIDYVPLRFSNKLLNNFYHLIEKLSAQYTDWTWNLSPRMIQARNKKWKMKMPHQLVVPHGVHYKRIIRLPFTKINKSEIIYMGTLLKKQGIQFLLEAFPYIIKKIPTVSLTIIGRGPYEAELKEKVKQLKLESYVNFLGYMPSHKDMENRMAKGAVAIALYNRKEDRSDFTYYADPGKIKNYLGAGLPVIMTDVAWIVKEIEKAKCGLVVTLNTKDITKKIIDILINTSKLQKYRENALSFAKNYDWSTVFQKALSYIE